MMVGTHKVAVAAHGGDLAHFGHRAQAAGQLADDFLFVAAQLVDIDHGCAKVHAQVGHVAHFVHHRCDMQQGFGWDAAHVQAHATQGGVTLDDDDFQAQVGGAEGGGIATGATAQHQQVALQVSRACKAGGSGGCGGRCGSKDRRRRCRYHRCSCLRFLSKRRSLIWR